MTGRYLDSAGRRAGLAWARDWRRRNKPVFDAIYGPEIRRSAAHERRRGLAYARDWRRRTRPEFDLLYGSTNR